MPTRGLQLRSPVRASGALELSLVEVPVAPPTADASRYSRTVPLAETLTLEAIAVYGRRSTSEKCLIVSDAG